MRPLFALAIAIPLALASACGGVAAPELPDAFEHDPPPPPPPPEVWTAVGGVDAFAVFAVAADPQSAVVLAGLGGTGNDCRLAPDQPGCTLLRSIDDGATFVPVADNIDFLDARAVAMNGAIAVAALRGAFGVSDDRILLSEDAGLTWRVVSSSADIGEQHKAIAIDPTAPLDIYAGDFRLASHGAGDSYLLASRDGGRTYTHLPETTGNELRAYAFAFDTDGVLYAAGTGTPALGQSFDRGASFTSLGVASLVYAIAIEPGAPEVIYAGTRDDGVLRSIDGGLTFAPTGAGLVGAVNALLVDPEAPETIYAATDTGVFVSGNRGGSWSSFADGLPAQINVTSLALTPAHSLIIGTRTGLYRRGLP
jgi:hypothetical protein